MSLDRVYNMCGGKHYGVTASCSVCLTQRLICVYSYKRSIKSSWHKTYRCQDCMNIGRSYSDEHKNAISKALRGKPLTEQRKRNISKSLCELGSHKGFPKKWPEYNGKKFRSSYEVRCAKALDAANIKWEYESVRLEVEVSPNIIRSYKPDFYLPEFDRYIEVKGFWREDAKIKFEAANMFLGNKITLVTLEVLESVGA